MSKRLSAIALGSAVAVALVGCTAGGSTDSAPGSDVDLTDVDYNGSVSVITRYAGENAAFFEQVAKDYEAKHEGVTIDLQQESDQGYKDKIKTLVASQSVPDVYFSWPGEYAAQFFDNGLALDLSDVIAPSTEWGGTFNEAALDTFSDDGSYYGVPLALDAKFMLYNEKLFAESGVDVPGNHEELIQACDDLTDKGVTPMSFGNKDGWPAIHFITSLNSYNVPAETLSADYEPATAKFEDPGYVKALEQFQEILTNCTDTQEQANGSDYYSERNRFGDGDVAMFYVENVEFAATTPEGSAAEEDGYGVFKLPVPEDAKGDQGSLTGAPDGFLVNPNAENLPLAVDFMEFATNKQNAAALYETIGFPSATKDGLAETDVTPQLEESVKQVDEASSLAVWLDTVTVPDVAQAYLSGVQGLISGNKSPEQVMSDVKKASDSTAS
ncbi:ABC transporter substrate-binding protein [Paramicrobacterium chengjingii]|uniref:Extracellular solute-binding protein n=1 Tax=Paramicrobacterium chengjingii TaxID=2769067 RepID=A0ABX6YGA7_9MICO|nr:extracellular solute-binding protein [Microbacterium chengjingii]QPZ37823.1 extracellular solute-binding protein [Microbacterium chengjingii]